MLAEPESPENYKYSGQDERNGGAVNIFSTGGCLDGEEDDFRANYPYRPRESIYQSSNKKESASAEGNFYCSPTFNTLRNSYDVSADQYELNRGSSDAKRNGGSTSSPSKNQPGSGSGQPGSMLSLGA